MFSISSMRLLLVPHTWSGRPRNTPKSCKWQLAGTKAPGLVCLLDGIVVQQATRANLGSDLVKKGSHFRVVDLPNRTFQKLQKATSYNRTAGAHLDDQSIGSVEHLACINHLRRGTRLLVRSFPGSSKSNIVSPRVPALRRLLSVGARL